MQLKSGVFLLAASGLMLMGCVVHEGGGYYDRSYGYHDRGYSYADRDRFERHDYDRDRYYWR